jgi:hypothetical protein
MKNSKTFFARLQFAVGTLCFGILFLILFPPYYYGGKFKDIKLKSHYNSIKENWGTPGWEKNENGERILMYHKGIVQEKYVFKFGIKDSLLVFKYSDI